MVSQDMDDSLRENLASQGRGRTLELDADQARAENSGLSATLIEDAIEEALEWARRA
jgi:multidrug efflux pump subunit AcrB